MASNIERDAQDQDQTTGGSSGAIELVRSAPPLRAMSFDDFRDLNQRIEEYKRLFIVETDWQVFRGHDGKESRHLKQHRIQGLFTLAGLSLLGRKFTPTENTIPENEMALRKWPVKTEPEWECELVATNVFGQVFHGIGSFSGREAVRGYNSVRWEDLNSNRLKRMAFKRALAHLVKNALGGIPWISPEGDDEDTPQTPSTSMQPGANRQPARQVQAQAQADHERPASREQVDQIGRLARNNNEAMERFLKVAKVQAVAELTDEQAAALINALKG